MSRAGSFSFQLKNACDAVSKEIEQKQNRIILKLFRSFVLDSPVDKGSFRGSWIATYGSPNLDFVYNAPSKGITEGWATQKSYKRINDLLSGSKGDVLWITNNQPYAQKLEYGWSKQAPQGFVRRNIARFNEIAKRA